MRAAVSPSPIHTTFGSILIFNHPSISSVPASHPASVSISERLVSSLQLQARRAHRDDHRTCSKLGLEMIKPGFAGVHRPAGTGDARRGSRCAASHMPIRDMLLAFSSKKAVPDTTLLVPSPPTPPGTSRWLCARCSATAGGRQLPVPSQQPQQMAPLTVSPAAALVQGDIKLPMIPQRSPLVQVAQEVLMGSAPESKPVPELGRPPASGEQTDRSGQKPTVL